MPGDGDDVFNGLDEAPAVQLLIERAEQVDSMFAPSDADLRAIVNIVTFLEGLPLAIELAAAMTDVLNPTEIALRLADRFEVLTEGPRDAPVRQRTLRSAVEWSHDLLGPVEQHFFAEISVFAGGFDVTAAAVVTGSTETETIDLIGALLRRSLLCREPSSVGTSRYRILESLRQYGLERLAQGEDGWIDGVRDRHADYFALHAHRLDTAIIGADQVEGLASLIAEEDNLRAAMVWSLDTDRLEPGVAIAARAGRFWDWRGSLTEASMWMSRFAAQGHDRAETIPVFGLMLSWWSYFTAELGQIDEARVLADRALEVAESQGDHFATLAVFSMQSLYARLIEDYDEALRLDEAIRQGGEVMGDRWAGAWADNHDALILLATGDPDGSAVVAERSRQVFAAIGDRRATGWAITALALIATETEQFERALELASAAALISTQAGDGRNGAWAYEIAAAAARHLGDESAAGDLDDQARSLLTARGMPFSPWRRPSPRR